MPTGKISTQPLDAKKTPRKRKPEQEIDPRLRNALVELPADGKPADETPASKKPKTRPRRDPRAMVGEAAEIVLAMSLDALRQFRALDLDEATMVKQLKELSAIAFAAGKEAIAGADSERQRLALLTEDDLMSELEEAIKERRQ